MFVCQRDYLIQFFFFIIYQQKIMINSLNKSKDLLSATVIPKNYYQYNTQNNPLNPKNLPIKPLTINIPKDIPFNNSIQTPKTARNYNAEDKSSKKLKMFNKSINATPEKMRQNKQNSYVKLKKFISEIQHKQQTPKANSINESGRTKTQSIIIPKQMKDLTNKEDHYKQLRQTVSNVSSCKPLIQENVSKNTFQLNFDNFITSPYTDNNKQQHSAPISFRKKKQLQIVIPSTIKFKHKAQYSCFQLQRSKGPKQNGNYLQKMQIKNKMAEMISTTPTTPKALRTSVTPRASQDKLRLSKKVSKNSQMNATDPTGSYLIQNHQRKISNYGSFTPRKQRERQRQKQEIKLEDFELGSCKGQGRFGKVFPARHKKTGMVVGIKQIKKESVRLMMQQFIQEIKINMFLVHPNVTKTYGFFHDKIHFYIIMEYMQEGSLYRIIKLNKKISEKETKEKLYEICSAVKYLHDNQILHRDIKPQNIVLTNGVCKLCDFGWAVYSNQRRNTYCGTLDYVCPQILQGQSYDQFVDIWAIGVLAFEMLIGKAPFYHISRQQTMKSIMKCNINFPSQLSDGAKIFIQKALQKNADNRESVQYLLKDNFLKNQGFFF